MIGLALPSVRSLGGIRPCGQPQRIHECDKRGQVGDSAQEEKRRRRVHLKADVDVYRLRDMGQQRRRQDPPKPCLLPLGGSIRECDKPGSNAQKEREEQQSGSDCLKR